MARRLRWFAAISVTTGSLWAVIPGCGGGGSSNGSAQTCIDACKKDQMCFPDAGVSQDCTSFCNAQTQQESSNCTSAEVDALNTATQACLSKSCSELEPCLGAAYANSCLANNGSGGSSGNGSGGASGSGTGGASGSGTSGGSGLSGAGGGADCGACDGADVCCAAIQAFVGSDAGACDLVASCAATSGSDRDLVIGACMDLFTTGALLNIPACVR